MSDREDLDKLFEAALRQTEPPGYSIGRLSKTPGKAEPSGYTPAPPFARTPVPVSAPIAISQEAPLLDERGAASLDTAMNEELEAIVDAKMAKAKARRRRGAVMTLLFVALTFGGGAAWFVTSPQRMAALKEALAEIKSFGDVNGLVAKYQASLDRVALRSEQINQASAMLGVDPNSIATEDAGFDQEMRDLVGEEGGPTTAARDAKLREKFKPVEETGTLTR
jgi:hypothetical protein